METKEEFLEMVRLYLLFEESELPAYSSDKTVNAMLNCCQGKARL